MDRVKEAFGLSAAEQEKEALGYEPTERPTGSRIRVWGFDYLDESLQKFCMRRLEDILPEIGKGSDDDQLGTGLTGVASSKDR